MHSLFFKYSNMRAWRPEFSMWLEFAWLAHLPAERNTSSLYGDRRSIWCIARPLRKCVHQCKQRKFSPAPQISVYVGATTLGCRAALIVLSLSMCASLTESLFFHLISAKQTNWFCCYWWSAGCCSWINHKDERLTLRQFIVITGTIRGFCLDSRSAYVTGGLSLKSHLCHGQSWCSGCDFSH